MIVIIDYGMGNLGSIQNMLKKIGAKGIISSDISDIQKADKLILPGVGAFDNGMKNLQKLELIPILNEKVLVNKTPILGICLGMQLLGKKSEEGQLAGLGWVEAETIKFKFDDNQANFKIPHMGWNTIQIKKESSLFKNMYENARFYFVHSYHLVCKNKQDVLTETNYGFDFVSSVEKNNIIGVQFHPEKSHKFGMKLFKNFVENI
jgi:glutamine amidotransferase